MFVNIMEDAKKNPIKLFVHIGKAGTDISAWANCIADLVSNILLSDGLDAAIKQLLDIKTSRFTLARNPINGRDYTIDSGPSAIAHALILYRLDKYEQMLRSMNLHNVSYDTPYKPPSRLR